MAGRKSVRAGTALLLGALVGSGVTPLFAQLLFAAGISPVATTLYRFILPAVLAAPFMRADRRQRPEALRMALLGMVNAMGVFFFFHALETIPASTAILIYYTYPALSVIVGWVVYRRVPSRNMLVGAALVVVAASLVVGPDSLHPEAMSDAALCFVAPLAYALMIQYIARPCRVLPPSRRIAFSLAGHVVVLLPMTLVVAPLTLPTTFPAVLAVLGLGVLSAALPQVLFNLGASRVGPERTAIFGAFELVVAMLTGAVLLGGPFGRLEITAMVLILIAMLLRQGSATQHRSIRGVGASGVEAARAEANELLRKYHFGEAGVTSQTRLT